MRFRYGIKRLERREIKILSGYLVKWGRDSWGADLSCSGEGRIWVDMSCDDEGWIWVAAVWDRGGSKGGTESKERGSWDSEKWEVERPRRCESEMRAWGCATAVSLDFERVRRERDRVWFFWLWPKGLNLCVAGWVTGWGNEDYGRVWVVPILSGMGMGLWVVIGLYIYII